MADNSGKDEGQLTTRPRNSRADRLKNALRENLKRRKMQARERGRGGDAPSTGDKPSLHDDGGDEPTRDKCWPGIANDMRAVKMAADGGSGHGSNIVVRSTRPFARPEQTFPTLTEAEIARMRRFGELKSFSDGELMFETGKPGRGMFVVLSGYIAITERDGLGHVTPIVEQGPGQFVTEVGQLSGRVSLVDGRAEGNVETLLIPPDKLRALLVAEAELGERIMRALILRRVGLLEVGAGGPIIVGLAEDGDVLRLEGFLSRNGHPHERLDPANDPEAKALVERFHIAPAELPIVLCPNGELLRNPSEI